MTPEWERWQQRALAPLQQFFWQFSETIPEEANFHANQESINGKSAFSLVVCLILCTFAAGK